MRQAADCNPGNEIGQFIDKWLVDRYPEWILCKEIAVSHKTLHCPIKHMAAQRAARSCVFGGRNCRTRSTAAERYEVVLVAMNFRKTFDGCALSQANMRM